MGFLTEVTLGGYALSFPLSPDEDEAGQGGAVAAVAAPATASAAEASSAAEAAARGSEAGCRGSAGGDDTKLNLLALEYRTDSRALVPGCGCFTCRNHTRAYLHHLLHTHEMTAQVGRLAGLCCPCQAGGAWLNWQAGLLPHRASPSTQTPLSNCGAAAPTEQQAAHSAPLNAHSSGSTHLPTLLLLLLPGLAGGAQHPPLPALVRRGAASRRCGAAGGVCRLVPGAAAASHHGVSELETLGGKILLFSLSGCMAMLHCYFEMRCVTYILILRAYTSWLKHPWLLLLCSGKRRRI